MLWRGSLPVAICFAGQLALSNTAYMHSSVAFLQMLKESNIALVYALSLAFSLEKFSGRNVAMLGCILCATTLTIHGELNFNMTGFMIQGTSQLFESLKIVLQVMLLSQAGKKLDALSFVLVVLPFCFILLGSALCVSSIMYPDYKGASSIPPLDLVRVWSPHLVVNACLAFALNVVIALFVKHSSGVTFVLAGVVKDAMIVCAGGMVLGEVISAQQVLGFSLQLALITLLALAKTFPERFEPGVILGLTYTQEKATVSLEASYGATEAKSAPA